MKSSVSCSVGLDYACFVVQITELRFFLMIFSCLFILNHVKEKFVRHQLGSLIPGHIRKLMNGAELQQQPQVLLSRLQFIYVPLIYMCLIFILVFSSFCVGAARRKFTSCFSVTVCDK